ncbi:hypothetical protein HMI54_003979 [Coelomomyces lativittatus]|nr:hypothetical protein HMI55_002435 [Coelomomyces lativittatus]KAJ1507610.1 hypothetical protein HMI54_003979 [Coelomomyces lativittatus]
MAPFLVGFEFTQSFTTKSSSSRVMTWTPRLLLLLSLLLCRSLLEVSLESIRFTPFNSFTLKEGLLVPSHSFIKNYIEESTFLVDFQVKELSYHPEKDLERLLFDEHEAMSHDMFVKNMVENGDLEETERPSPTLTLGLFLSHILDDHACVCEDDDYDFSQYEIDEDEVEEEDEVFMNFVHEEEE